MKINKKILALSITLLSLNAFADEHHAEHNHFEGAYVVLANEWKSASVKVDDEKIKKSESAPSLAVGYTFAIDSHSTLGVKLTVDTKNGEYGAGETVLGAGETMVQEKSHYSLAVEPGYAFDDKLLVFGILGYHHAKANLLLDEVSQGQATLSGVGYGLGAKYAFADHMFLMLEYQHVNYSSTTIDASKIKPASDVIALGLGYHF